MRALALPCLAFLGVALAGCDKAPEQKAPEQKAPAAVVAQSTPAPKKVKAPVDKKCKKDDCAITVLTNSCPKAVISVSHGAVGVTKGITDVPITWTVDDSHYEFTQTGVVIDAPAGVFTGCAASPSGKEFSCVDTNSQGIDDKEYKYTVTVKPKHGGAACPALDPTIINDY